MTMMMTSCVARAATGEVTVVGCDQGREVISICKLVCCKRAETIVVAVSVSVKSLKFSFSF